MKVALCYSGQAGGFSRAFSSQKQSFYSECDDVFLYTSNLVSHKTHNRPQLKPESKVFDYLVGGTGWAKNYKTYGVIYKVSDQTVLNTIKPLNEKLATYKIEDENLEESLLDSNMSKWQWMRKRQLWKMFKCNELVNTFEKKYDIVVRCRMEFMPRVIIPIKEIYSRNKDENKIFIFGGWNCVAPMVFMDKFMCDGFAFGSPKAMNAFSSLYLQEEPYPYNPKYEESWKKFGDNVEYQLEKHLQLNNIKIQYIGTERSMYHILR